MRADRCDPDRLIALAQAGDLQALDDLTRCYGARLLAVGRRACADEQQAEDAVQDALLNAAERLDQFRGEGRLDSWLARMVANACNHMRRGRKNDPAWHDAEADPQGGPDPEQEAARLELAERLNAALLDLPAQDRTLVLLADVEGFKGPEIAERMGLSPVVIRKRLSRARSRLREQLSVTLLPPDASDGQRRNP